MLKKLFPRNDNFFLFFENHAQMIVKAAQGLLDFARKDCDGQASYNYIKSCEHEGDKITHQCVEALHKNFITPFERSDIHHLISNMDDILDEIEEAARFFMLYQLKHFRKDAEELAKIVVESTKETYEAVKKLRSMKNSVMQEHFLRINQLENDSDILFMDSLSRLLEEEKDPFVFIKWKEVYEHLEHANDACEDVANDLEGIILEYD